MSKQKSVLVATIGTRDVAFCSTSGEWSNIGNAFTTIDNDISEQVQVQIELGLDNSNFLFNGEQITNPNKKWLFAPI